MQHETIKEAYIDMHNEENKVMSDKEIQELLFKLTDVQRYHPKITPKMKKMINDLQKEMLKAELAKED